MVDIEEKQSLRTNKCKSIGIIDEPVAPGATDFLDIKIHSKSLIDFVKDTNTPITIGVQGEWGSGKTSLLNSIYHAYSNDIQCKQIWINAWEHSLLSTPEESLLKIVNKIIDELLEADGDVNRKEKIVGSAKKIFQGALRVGANVAMGSEASKVAEELLGSSSQSIAGLRKQLNELVVEIAERPTNPYQKIIIYVDDLDRIEPKNAVAILELLKNIFSVPKCIFVLAIDYQVVVKGLEHKFGKQTAENEWEFRAFFDKIIQLPFMMPMGQYNIGKYVNSLLLDIGFVEGEGLDAKAIQEIILRSIGGNPRSIKRLANSISLIQIFIKNKIDIDPPDNNESDEEDVTKDEEKLLIFCLLCLQIAYPPIYSVLVKEPDFTKWNDDFAYGETNRSEEKQKEIFEREFAIAKQSDDFDEDWEQAIYRICFARPRLKPRVSDISKFFSYVKDEIFSERQEIIGDVLERILSQTSVTSVTSTDQGQIILPERQGAYKRRYLEGFDSFILDKKQNYKYFSESIAKLIEVIYQDVKSLLESVEFSFHGSATAYIKKHKFFLINFGDGKYKEQCRIDLIKHFKHDYRIPRIKDIESQMTRKFSIGKPSSAHNSHMFKLYIPDLETYQSNKNIFLEIVKESYEMASNNWENLLKIQEDDGKFKNKEVDIVAGNFKKETDKRKQYEELALKYLDPAYKYDL
jgi:hypothetical protein